MYTVKKKITRYKAVGNDCQF